MNKNELAKAFDVSLVTISNWVRRGAPSKKKGKLFVFNLPDVIKWHGETFVDDAETEDESEFPSISTSRRKYEHFRAVEA